MQGLLYRFRSINSFLGKGELENQEIYFASVDELNDPFEGFKNIFWTGDKIVWKNILKHYLLCLLHVNSLFFVGNEIYEIKDDDISIVKPPNNLNIHQECCVFFFKNQHINECINYLSSNERKLKRNELLFLLTSLHNYALKCIFQKFEVHIKQPEVFNLFKTAEEIFTVYQQILKNEKECEETYFEKQNNLKDQLYLILLNTNPEFSKSNNKKFIFFEFPEKYLNKLETLIYYQHYVASFMNDHRNSAMWSHYGDHHKGICLIYKPITMNMQKCLPLRQITGLNSSIRKTELCFGTVNHEFFEVNYSKQYPEIDFFRSLGQLPIPILDEYWYTDENENISSCRNVINNENWRNQYWKNFNFNINTKLPSWHHEKEYRLIFSSFLFDLQESKI